MGACAAQRTLSVNFALGFVFGIALCYIFLQSKLRKLQHQSFIDQQHNIQLQLEKEKIEAILHERTTNLKTSQQDIEKTLAHVAQQTMNATQQSFLNWSQQMTENFHQKTDAQLKAHGHAMHNMTTPIQNVLTQMEHKLLNLEKTYTDSHISLREYVQNLTEMQHSWRLETADLVNALRAPHTKGYWGEMQLQRVVELAGMQEYCDFNTQATFKTDARTLRPDMLVRLPENRIIILDAKTPLNHYFEAINANNDDDRIREEKAYVKLLRAHIKRLSGQNYDMLHPHAPEFVVLFLPSEALLAFALNVDPELWENATRARIILSTPSTLIALLKTVAYSWKQRSWHENAQRIVQVTHDVFEHLKTFSLQFDKMGKLMDQSTRQHAQLRHDLQHNVLDTFESFHISHTDQHALQRNASQTSNDEEHNDHDIK